MVKHGLVRFQIHIHCSATGHIFQMVFQHPYDSLNPRFTVAQTIAEPLLKHSLATTAECSDRIDELMELVDLSADLRYRRPRQLSGGQCQRVGIARALAMKPEFLFNCQNRAQNF
jgi:peptide/nickel transport system ATP-binding protein